MGRNIWTCAVFATTSFNFGLQPILFHTIVTEGQYMLFSIKEFLNKNRAELFDCGVSNDMSKVTH